MDTFWGDNSIDPIEEDLNPITLTGLERMPSLKKKLSTCKKIVNVFDIKEEDEGDKWIMTCW